MVTDSFDDRRFPRGTLFGAAALLVVTLGLVSASRLGVIGMAPLTSGSPAVTRDLRFMDQPDGTVAVYDVNVDRVVFVVPPGTNGFLRSVVRGLARDRKLESIGVEPPFRLTRWDDGRLSLEDPSTGRHIDDLAAFGPTNEAAFAQLLTAQGTTP